jgi:hypothetical protein
MSSQKQILRASSALASASLVVLVCGCSEPTSGIVTGLVTVDGTAAKTGSIAFFPVNGQGATAGAVIADGRYEVTAPFGVMKVEIRVPRIVGEQKLYDTTDSPVRSRLTEALPARYNDATELQLEVQPGEMEQNFELTTK